MGRFWRSALWHLHPAVRSGDDLTLGERSAETAMRGMGSWAFIFVQTLIVVAWFVVNTATSARWDPYPFILLNLAFSTQAAYAAPLILLAQRRQDAKSSEVAVHTLENTATLRELLQRNTDLTEQVERLTEQIHTHITTTGRPD